MIEQTQFKNRLLDSLLHLKSEFQNWVDKVIGEKRCSMTQFMLISLSSALLCCLGINFENEWVIYASLLMSPFVDNCLRLIIAIYVRENEIIWQSLINLVLGSLVVLIFGAIYFRWTPFAFDLKFLFESAEVDLSVYLFTFIAALGFGFYDNSLKQIMTWLLSILMKWMVLFSFSGYLLSIQDWESILQVVIQFKLLFVFLFLGIFISLSVFRVQKSDYSTNLQKFLLNSSIVLLVILTFYFGGREFYHLTTKHNVEQYLYSELASRSFIINTYSIDKNSREITVYYSGIKPTSSQDEELKKKYHIGSYHLVFQEVK